MNIKKLIHVAFFIICSQTLSGCGSDSDNTSTDGAPGPASATIEADNVILVLSGTDNDVNLVALDAVSVSDNSGFVVSSVTSLSGAPECAQYSIHNEGFAIDRSKDNGEVKVCDYRYTVALSQRQTLSSNSYPSGIVRVAMTPRAVTVEDMVPVSAVALAGQTTKINLKTLLDAVGEDITTPSGLTLGGISHAYSPSGSAKVSPSPATHELTYEPGSFKEGIDRVLFSYSSASAVKFGYLDIAVTEKVNQGLVVKPANVYGAVVGVNVEHVIDIEPYVTDHDGKGYYLAHVDSFHATVTKEPSPDTTKLRFKSGQSGKHYVSFAVADGQGAYEMGLIEVLVGTAWLDIELGWLERLTAPITVVAADRGSVDYSGAMSDSGYTPALSIAGFTSDKAAKYCEDKGGRLPTVAELTEVITKKPKDNYDWPTQQAYLATVTNHSATPEYRKMTLTSGSTDSSADSTSHYNVTCLISGSFSGLHGRALPEAGNSVKLDFKLLNHKGQPMANKTVAVSSVSRNGPKAPAHNATGIQSSYQTDADGEFSVTVTNGEEENIWVTASYDGYSRTAVAHFEWPLVVGQGSMGAIDADDKVSVWGETNCSQPTVDCDDTDIMTLNSFVAPNMNAVTGLSASGRVVGYGIDVPESTNKTEDVIEVIAGANSYVALHNDRRVSTWGTNPLDLSIDNAEKVVMDHTGSSFAALTLDGTVVGWGSVTPGNDKVIDSDKPIESIWPGQNAFAAIQKDTGKAFVWGAGKNADITCDNSSDCVAISTDDLNSGVVKVVFNEQAGAAIKSDGSVVTWGDINSGGDPTCAQSGTNCSSVPAALSDIADIIAGYNSFAAVNKDGSVVAVWGDKTQGGSLSCSDSSCSAATSSDLSQIEDIIGGQNSFVVSLKGGTLDAWGLKASGGEIAFGSVTDTEKLISTGTGGVYPGFAVINKSDKAYAWGAAQYQCDSKAYCEFTDITHAVIGEQTGAVITTSGVVTTFGAAGKGGDSSSVQPLNLK